MGRIKWEEMTHEEIKTAADEGALILVPVGAIEQHSRHLPVNTDSIIASELALRCASALGNKQRALVTPCVWSGSSRHHMGFPGTLSTTDLSLQSLIDELCRSICAHGFRRIVLFNGHGGNSAALVSIALQMGAQLDCSVAALDYWNMIDTLLPDLIDERPADIGHASELETSLIMVFRPDLIRENALSELAPVAKPKEESLVYFQDFRTLTSEGHIGHPEWADEAKGRRLIEAITSEFVTLISNWNKE